MTSMSTIKGYLHELKEQYLKIRATTNWFGTARSVMSFLVRIAPRVLWFFVVKRAALVARDFAESLSLPDEVFNRHRY